mmetsp:Transcript_79591/g.200182  ORF Transcript_79591/g.200182 Transcript_79591/m.200182 type:complete len:418 (+) Transcript_79591:115-1368(+)
MALCLAKNLLDERQTWAVQVLLFLFGLAAPSHGRLSKVVPQPTSAGEYAVRTVAEAGSHWNFAMHGRDWLEGFCTHADNQSPIDLPVDAPPGDGLAYRYVQGIEPIELKSQQSTLSLDVAGLGMGGVMYKDAFYYLLNVNVKAISEHTFAGKHTLAELHMVHKKASNGDMLIIAIPLECTSPSCGLAAASAPAPAPAPDPEPTAVLDTAEPLSPPRWADLPARLSSHTPPAAREPNFNPFVQAFLKVPPPPLGHKVMVAASPAEPLEFIGLITGTSSGATAAAVPFYAYNGSLTVPPCAENVAWFVRRHALVIGDLQARRLHEGLLSLSGGQGNYRAVQPIGSRTINLVPVIPAPPIPPPPKEITLYPPLMSERELRARNLAREALGTASDATEQTYVMDRHTQAAARALERVLSPR